MKSAFLTSGWGLPLTVGVAMHVGLAFIPVAFSQGSGVQNQPQPIQINLVAVKQEPPPVMMPEPPVVSEVVPAAEPAEVVPAPRPKPRKKRTQNQVPVETAATPTEENTAFAAADAVVDPEPLEQAEITPQPAELPVEEAVVAEASNHAPPPAPTKKFDMRGYGMGIFSAVQAKQQYPRAAERFRLEGVAKVRIRINRDGSLADRPQVVTSTTHALLDREALRMVEVAAPFAPLPDGFTEQTQEFVIPINFKLPRS